MDSSLKPSRKTLPEREQKICARLKEMRLALRFSQKEVGDQIGITRERLASYEDSRVPLRWEVALKFCRQFIVSEEWLAAGDAHIKERVTPENDRVSRRVTLQNYRRMCASLATEPLIHQVKPGLLFSVAFDEVFAGPYREFFHLYQLPRVILFEGDNPQLTRNYLDFVVDSSLSGLDTGKAHRLLISVAENAALSAEEIAGGGLSHSEIQRLINEGIVEGKLSWRDDPEVWAWRNKRLEKFFEATAKTYIAGFPKTNWKNDLTPAARLAKALRDDRKRDKK